MISIRINIKVVVLSIFIAILMYPKTIDFLINSGKNIYIARKLSSASIQSNMNVSNDDKTRIVFMFDSGWKSIYSEAYNVLSKYNYKASVSIIPSLIDEKEYMSYEQLAELYLQGWDLLNHSYSHKEGIYEDTDETLSDFNRARRWMENRYIGKYSDMIVMPYGEINPYLIMHLKNANYRNIRTSSNIIMLDSSDYYYYPATVVSLLTDVTVDRVKDLLKKVNSEYKTVIFILNKIEEMNDEFGMTYRKDKFEEIIKFISEHSEEFEVITYSQLFGE